VLLAEVLRSKSLSSLGLTELAPTVIGSSAPIEKTLAALRSAGFAPLAENPDGSRLFEQTRQVRAVGGGRAQVGPVDADSSWLGGIPEELLEELPDEFFDELAEGFGDELSQQLLSWSQTAGSGQQPTLSDPSGLARRLLRRGQARDIGPGRARRPRRR
jgi:hypothetical protein